jgi:hypothetical protein
MKSLERILKGVKKIAQTGALIGLGVIQTGNTYTGEINIEPQPAPTASYQKEEAQDKNSLKISYKEWRGVMFNSEGGQKAEELLKQRGQYIATHGDAAYEHLSDKDERKFNGEFSEQIEEQIERAKANQQTENSMMMYQALANLFQEKKEVQKVQILSNLGRLDEPNLQNIYGIDIDFSKPEEITKGVKVLLYLDQKYAKKYNNKRMKQLSRD